MSRESSRQPDRHPGREPTAPVSPARPVDAPGGEPLRSPSLMPLPASGLRRTNHPDPRGLPPPEVKVATGWRVSCDGGEGALGHPRVWLSIPHDIGFTDCGYCDARFVHQDFVGPGAAGEAGDAEALDARGTHGRGLHEPADHTQPADRGEAILDRQADLGEGPAGGQADR